MNYSRIPFPFTFSFPSFFASSSVLEQPIFPGGPSLRTILGVLLFGIGITIETMSELQRRGFKGDRRNVGKPFKGGLFGLARNINYGGHVLWKMGNALSAGGFVWGGLAGGGYFYDFATRGVPVLDEYCEKKVCNVVFVYFFFFFFLLSFFDFFPFFLLLPPLFSSFTVMSSRPKIK